LETPYRSLPERNRLSSPTFMTRPYGNDTEPVTDTIMDSMDDG